MNTPCQATSFRDVPIDYLVALVWQSSLLAARRKGEIADTLLLLEHTPVITIGRGSRDMGDLCASEADLAARGIALVKTDRGGEMTYHAPGQLVAYPIVDLTSRGSDLHRYLRDLEETVIQTLATFGVEGRRIAGLTGVWVGDQKICAMGIKVSRWVSMHGLALNIDIDLAPFQRDIIPCGIRDKGVTSLATLGVAADRQAVEAALLRAFADVMRVRIEMVNEKTMRDDLRKLCTQE